jgi:hypothetical protein
MRAFVDAVDLARVQFVVWKALVEFRKNFPGTDGIVIPQRRARQHQLGKRLQIVTVKRRLANLFEPLLASVFEPVTRRRTRRGAALRLSR